jgi:hypothetical protein
MKHKSGCISSIYMPFMREEEPRVLSPNSVRHSMCSRGIWLLLPWREKVEIGGEARGEETWEHAGVRPL